MVATAHMPESPCSGVGTWADACATSSSSAGAGGSSGAARGSGRGSSSADERARGARARRSGRPRSRGDAGTPPPSSPPASSQHGEASAPHAPRRSGRGGGPVRGAPVASVVVAAPPPSPLPLHCTCGCGRGCTNLALPGQAVCQGCRDSHPITLRRRRCFCDCRGCRLWWSRCARPGCPCPASWNGDADEYCCRTCRGGEPCSAPFHRQPSDPDIFPF